MPSRLIQLKDIDSSPNDLLFPITTGEAVSVTFDGTSHTLQSVVDLIPTAGGSGGGGGSTQTIAANNVILSTSPADYISLNGGGTYKTIQLPASCPWSISLGNIDSSGSITNGTVAPASGQNLAVTDTTGLVSKSSISFDTTDTSKYLRHDGTWASVSSGSTVVGKAVTLGTTPTAVLMVNGSDSGSVALPAAATNAVGIVQLTDSTSSTSTTTAATPNSVKSAYDLAAAAIPKSIGTAQGDIIYFTGSGAPARLAKGTAGQVLTMNSGATAPSWATPSSGGGSLVVPFTIDSSQSTTTVSTTTSIDTIVNAINDGKYVVGESSLFGLIRFQLTMWWEESGSARIVVFTAQVDLNGYTITGNSEYSGGTWTDQWSIEEKGVSLDSLTDVAANGASNGQVLGYSSNTNSWFPMTVSGGGGGGSSTLSGLNDVSISSAASGQSLIFNGTNWVNSFNSSGFNQVTAVYDANSSLQGCSLFRANCDGNKRNFIIISLSSSHFPQGEELVVYLDNAVPYTDNYIFIDNGTGIAQSWCPDALAIFDSSSNHLSDFVLLPADSNGDNVIVIPVGYSLWGAVNVRSGGVNNAAMLTFGGRFNEV